MRGLSTEASDTGGWDTQFSAPLVTHLRLGSERGNRVTPGGGQISPSGWISPSGSQLVIAGLREGGVRCFREKESLLGPGCQRRGCRMRGRPLPTHPPGPFALSPRDKRGGRKR